MSQGKTLIEIKNLEKHFGRLQVLKGISIDVHQGDVLAVIGPSGSGKSTLIRCINQLETPTAGQVIFEGLDLTGKKVDLDKMRQKIGMVFQNFNLFNNMTVIDNITAGPIKVLGIAKEEAQKQAMELLARVGLADKAQEYPIKLSGGQKQRVGIARALSTQPKVLLCDEATSALDPQTTASVLQLLAEINRELKLTIVLITHEMDVIRRVCDVVAVMDAGKIVEQGPVADVFLHPKHPTTKRFVQEDEQIDESEQRDDFAHVPGRIVRLTFQGEATYAPLLGTIARETGVDYSILAGRIDRIKDTPYGQLTLAITGGDMDAAFARFTAADVHMEVLR